MQGKLTRKSNNRLSKEMLWHHVVHTKLAN